MPAISDRAPRVCAWRHRCSPCRSICGGWRPPGDPYQSSKASRRQQAVLRRARRISASPAPGRSSTSLAPSRPRRRQQDLALFDRKGSRRAAEAPAAAPTESPRLSPDGTRIAFGSDDGKEASVWVYDLSGTSAARRLTFGGQQSVSGLVRRRSARRISVGSRAGPRHLLAARRRRRHGRAADEAGTRDCPRAPDAWAPKGDTLLFSVTKGSSVALWTLSLTDRKAAPFGGVQSTSALLPNAVFSPDGRLGGVRIWWNRWVCRFRPAVSGDGLYLSDFKEWVSSALVG